MFIIEDIPIVNPSLKPSDNLTVKEKRAAYYRANREKIISLRKEYYEKNREVVIDYNKKYRKINKKNVAAYNKEYYANNKQNLIKQSREYYKTNKEDAQAHMKIYRDKNVCKLSASYKKLSNSYTSSEVLKCKLSESDDAKFIDGVVTVLCKKCGRRFAPIRSQIVSRIRSFEGKQAGESNFYCSDICKNSCDLYNFTTGLQTDPRSKKYVKKTTAKKARACRDKSLKQIQCDHNSGQSYCERCGDFIDVELHHSLPIAQYGKEAVNSASHILLCAGCHVDLHNNCGKNI